MIQKIKEEIERQIEEGKVKCQQSQENNDRESFVAWSEHVATCGQLLVFIDSLQEEPKCIYNRTLEERKKFCKYCSAFCKVRIKEEPASEDLEEASWKYSDRDGIGYGQRYAMQIDFKAGAEWQKKKDEKTVSHASEDLEEEIDRFEDWINNFNQSDYPTSYTVRDIARHFAKWQENKDKQSLIDNGTVLLTEDEFEKLKRGIIQSEKDKQQMKEIHQTEYEKGRFDMRDEMMKDAVKGEIGDIMPLIEVGEMNNYLKYVKAHGLKPGDKVKIIIVKEEKK